MVLRWSSRRRSPRRRDRGANPRIRSDARRERQEGAMTTATPTQLGMVGLGRMGANIVRRLMRDGHPCVAYDLSADAIASLVSEGATGAGTIPEFVAALTPPRAVWVMVPAGEPTEHAVGSLADALAPEDA